MPAPLFLSLVEFPGDGTTVNWEFNFGGGYINRSHVKALIRDEFGAPTDYELTDDNFVTPFTLSITPPVPVGHTLRIYRDTPRDEPLVDFTGGSNFTEANLDLLARQTIMCAAEAFDAGAYAEAFDLLGQAQTAASQAAAALAAAIQAETESAVSASTAAAAAGAATTQASLANTRRVQAEDARDIALSARDAALGHRDDAVASATAASGSAGLATTERVAAQTARTGAETARSGAEGARDTALTAQAGAVTAQNNAAASAGAAATSASNAAASAAAAATFNPANFVGRASGAAELPTWTTATRPTGANGRLGFNMDTQQVERAVGTTWGPIGALVTAVIPTTSGTVHEISGIPASASGVTLVLDNVTTNSSGDLRVQLASIDGLVTTGYLGSVVTLETTNNVQATNGVPLRRAGGADAPTGHILIMRVPGTFNYVLTGQIRRNTSSQTTVLGSITLPGVLTGVALVSPSGSGTFNGGNMFAIIR